MRWTPKRLGAVWIGAVALLAFAAATLRRSPAPSGQATRAIVDDKSDFWARFDGDERAAIHASLAPYQRRPLAFILQTTRLTSGGEAHLLEAAGDVAGGRVRWKRPRLAGVGNQTALEATLCAAPEGGVLLVWRQANRSTGDREAWARHYDAAGEVAREFRLAGPLGAYGSHSAILWPGRGWVVAINEYETRTGELIGGATVRLFGFDGAPLWTDGRCLDLGRPGDNQISLALDSSESVSLLWYRWRSEPDAARAANLFVTQRFSPAGEPRWSRPVTAGEAPDFPRGAPRRIELRRLRNGVVRASLYEDRPGAPRGFDEYLSQIDADGRVRLIPLSPRPPSAEPPRIG
jgi:hypothetical protein